MKSNSEPTFLFPLSSYVSRLLIILALLLTPVLSAVAQSPLEGKNRTDALLRMMRNYTAWESVELNGKLQSDMMPLGIRPSVKVYMKRGESLMISIRASIMGEVARLEAWGDTVMVVNKPKRTYCKATLRQLLSGNSFGIADLQSLLLGRIAIPGLGELSVGNSTVTTVYADGEGGLMLLPPEGNGALKEFSYGYLTYPDGRLQALMVQRAGADDTSSLIFNYSPGGSYSIAGEFAVAGKTFGGTLDFESPGWGAKPFGRFTPPASYTRLGVNQFFRSI